MSAWSRISFRGIFLSQLLVPACLEKLGKFEWSKAQVSAPPAAGVMQRWTSLTAGTTFTLKGKEE